MTINDKEILNILNLYNISHDIEGYNFFINHFNKEKSEYKAVVKVDLSNKTSVVIKCVKKENVSNGIIEQQSRFSESLRSNGILTPKRYKSGESYCIKYEIRRSGFGSIMLDTTVEDYLGEEIKAIDKGIAKKIGRLMGKIHRIAEENNLHINAPTIFNLMGYNEVSGFDELKRLYSDGMIEKEIFNKTYSAYNKRLNRIKAVWDSLPRFATQGDYSINNLTYLNGELGIFDYNIAGDEVLVADMVLEGLLVANEMDLAEGLTKLDKPDLFKEFEDGYKQSRDFTKEELLVFDDIYAVANALWFTRIKYNDNSLVKLIEKGEEQKKNELLNKIYSDLI